MNTETLKILTAEKSDSKLLCEFIQELADFEKLTQEVSVSVEVLEKNLFSKNSKAEAIIISFKNQPIGFALYFYNFSTFLGQPGLYLEDLYIRPAFRSRGFGKEVFKYLANVAVEKNCGRMEWSVLDWNTRAINFYESLGAKPQSEWTTYRLNSKALQDLALSKS